jgi:hypothetical protein
LRDPKQWKANLSTTPIFLFATAGLRLIPSVQSEGILSEIRKLIKSQYSFRFEDSWTRILRGTEEAIYDWLTVQQIILLQRNLTETDGGQVNSTKGIIDMGGGSIEVSFDPRSNVGAMPDNTTFQSVVFDEKDYNVYGYSYLYYGHNEARHRTQQMVIDDIQGVSIPQGRPHSPKNQMEPIVLRILASWRVTVRSSLARMVKNTLWRVPGMLVIAALLSAAYSQKAANSGILVLLIRSINLPSLVSVSWLSTDLLVSPIFTTSLTLLH